MLRTLSFCFQYIFKKKDRYTDYAKLNIVEHLALWAFCSIEMLKGKLPYRDFEAQFFGEMQAMEYYKKETNLQTFEDLNVFRLIKGGKHISQD